MSGYTVPDVAEDHEMTHNGAPDRFVLCSGGVNSTAMAHKMIEEYWSDDYGPWNKRPTVVYLDTTIGLSSQRAYVELLCDHYNWQLWKLRTHQNFDEHSEDQGFYGNQQHGKIYNVLKGRQLQQLTTVAGNPHLYFGSLIEEKGDHVERVAWNEGVRAHTHNPILQWSERDCVEYLRDRDIPFNPNWESDHFTDCGCGATASREELIELEAEGYEVFAEKLRDLETRVETGDRRETWAWGSFSEDERRRLDTEADDQQTTLSDLACGGDHCSGSTIRNVARED